MHHVFTRGGWLVVVAALAAACQRYDWVYQPKTDRQALHLVFTVQTPSKADVVFVIDNSDSMDPKQKVLRASLGGLLKTLAPNDTSYRIGIVSTDTIGWTVDCDGNPYVLPPSYLPTTLDNCDKRSIVLRRPHDGAFGRLMAAYSPEWFDPDNAAYDDSLRNPSLTAAQNADARAAFLKLVPTSATEGPRDASGKPTSKTLAEGVPWVIDRDIVRVDACKACNDCDCVSAGFKDQDCYKGCVAPVSQAIVQAVFNSNVDGLGINGSGWEQGMRASLLAVGINSDLSYPGPALEPGDSTMRPNGENTFTVLDALGKPVRGARWLRDEAILGIMYVSDEQDCSMPAATFPQIRALEEPRNQPVGSGCYQSDGLDRLIQTDRIAKLLTARKGSAARLTLGFIGGVTPKAVGEYQFGGGTPSDCAATGPEGAQTPSDLCRCLSTAKLDQRWCAYTENPPGATALCDALAGSRYVEVADRFRHTYDSICQSSYGNALSEFAKRLISACFELDMNAQPANNDPANIQVVRTAKSESADAQPTAQAYLGTCASPEAGTGWCYMAADISDPQNPQKPQVCLQGYDRLIGDVYDIFVVTTDKYDPSH